MRRTHLSWQHVLSQNALRRRICYWISSLLHTIVFEIQCLRCLSYRLPYTDKKIQLKGHVAVPMRLANEATAACDLPSVYLMRTSYLIVMPLIVKFFFKSVWNALSVSHWYFVDKPNMCRIVKFDVKFRQWNVILPKFVYVTEPPLVPTLLNIADVVAGVVVIAGFATMAPVVPAVVYSFTIICWGWLLFWALSLFRNTCNASMNGLAYSSCSFVTSCETKNKNRCSRHLYTIHGWWNDGNFEITTLIVLLEYKMLGVGVCSGSLDIINFSKSGVPHLSMFKSGELRTVAGITWLIRIFFPVCLLLLLVAKFKSRLIGRFKLPVARDCVVVGTYCPFSS